MVADVAERVGDVLRHTAGAPDRAIEAAYWLASPAVAVALLAVMCALVVLRVVIVGRVLRSRVAWAALPVNEFDPGPEDVARFAFQLARVRRRRRGWLERPASAVRIRLDSVPEGRLLYGVEAPEHARSVLRAAAYDHLELRDFEALDLDAQRPAARPVRVEAVAADDGGPPDLARIGEDRP